MSLFYFHFYKRIYIMLIASFLWTLNYRSTFKNNSDSMGLGSCWVLRFDDNFNQKYYLCFLFFGFFL